MVSVFIMDSLDFCGQLQHLSFLLPHPCHQADFICSTFTDKLLFSKFKVQLFMKDFFVMDVGMGCGLMSHILLLISGLYKVHYSLVSNKRTAWNKSTGP